MRSDEKQGLPKIYKGLNGLKTVALLLVLASVFFPTVFKGGILAYSLFFMLSGYLITLKLFTHYLKMGRVNLFAFWRRRFFKIVPALVFTLLMVATWISLFQANVLYQFKTYFIESLLFMGNWGQISRETPFYLAGQHLNVFAPFWALAVYVQLLLFWSLLLTLLLPKISPRQSLPSLGKLQYGQQEKSSSQEEEARTLLHKRKKVGRKRLLLASTLIFFLSIILLFIQFVRGATINHLALGTDTHAYSFFLGASLALLTPPAKLRNLGKILHHEIKAFSAILFFPSLALLVLSSPQSAWTYFLSGLIFQVFALLLLVFSFIPDSTVGIFLQSLPLQAISTRAYSIYLWFFPIWVLSFASLQIIHVSPVAVFFVQGILLLLLSEVFYHLVQKPMVYLSEGSPLLSSTTLASFERLRQARKLSLAFGLKLAAFILALLFFGFSSVYALVNSEPVASEETETLLQYMETKGYRDNDAAARFEEDTLKTEDTSLLQSGNEMGDKEKNHELSSSPSEKSASNSTGELKTWTEAEKVALRNQVEVSYHIKMHESQKVNDFSFVAERVPQLRLDEMEREVLAALPVAVVGDFMALTTQAKVKTIMPLATVDGNNNRQFAEGAQVVKKLAQEEQLPQVVVLMLGSNGVIQASQVNELCETYKDHLFVLVNTVVNNSSEKIANTALSDAVARQPNTILVDWYSLAKSRSAWFASDYVHPSTDGSEVYAQYIAKTLASEIIRQVSLNS